MDPGSRNPLGKYVSVRLGTDSNEALICGSKMKRKKNLAYRRRAELDHGQQAVDHPAEKKNQQPVSAMGINPITFQ